VYDDIIATVYAVENGFVVECREEKKEQKSSSKKDNCAPSCGPSYESKTYTAKNAAEALAILSTKMNAKDTKAYDEEFAKAAKAK
jgi:hypothetical protein